MRTLKSLLIAIVILWGLMALLVRSATPFIADYRDDLAAMLSDRLGAPVSIAALEARWYGLRPLVELRDIRIGEEPEAIDVAAAIVDLPLTGLLSGSPLDALRVTIDGLQLTAVREPGGQVRLAGLGRIDQEAPTGETAPPLPGRLQLVNTRVVWIDRKAGKPPITIDRITVMLQRDGQALTLRGRLDTPSGSADLAARLEGFLTTTDWGGVTYLRLDNLDVAALFEPYLPASYGLRSLELDLESWIHWEEALPRHSQGRFALDELLLHPLAEDALPLDLQHASANFSFSRRDDGLLIGVEDLRLELGEHRWPAGRLAFEYRAGDDGTRQIAAAADYLQIEDVVRILQVRLPHADLKEPFEALKPAGVLRDLRIKARLTPEDLTWRGSTDFAGLQIAPSQGAPGVAGISGSLHGQQDHIVLELDSRDATLDYPGLFREMLLLDRVQGRLDLTQLDDGWQLRSQRLAADAPHLRTVSRVDIEHRPQKPLFVDLQTDFRDGDAANAYRYYPAGVMSDKLVSWLDRSIKSGRIVAGSALFHGRTDEFAFEKTRSGSFQALFDVEDVVLDYNEGWPEIQQLAARVKFHGNQMDIHSDEGRIYDSRLNAVSARIGTLEPTGPLLVAGRIEGPLRSNLRVLREGALRERFGRFTEGLLGTGQTALDIGFQIPLGQLGDYALDGQLTFDENVLTLPAWDFELDKLSGRLDFTLDGFKARGITAQALGAPVAIDILPLADGAIRLRASAHLDTERIGRQLPALPSGIGEGSADFVIDIDIPSAYAPPDSPSMMTVNSRLQGIAIALPPPLGKPAAATRALNVQLPLSGRPTPGSLQYGDVLSARFSKDARRVDVILGGGDARLQADTGIRVGGRLDEVDLLAWQDAIAGLPEARAEHGLPVLLDLIIDRLHADTLHLDALRLNATQQQGLWRGILDAPNLAGRFTLPVDSGSVPIQVELERLHLELPLGDVSVDTPPVPDPDAGPDPLDLPGLVLSIADLRLNAAELGQLRLDARRGPGGLHLTEFSLREGALELASAGYWARDPAGLQTQLGGSFETDDLGGLLVDMGYSRQLEKAGGKVDFLLRWPGDPAQFHRATVSGTITLDIGGGRILELDPGVTRVVGLLNLNALTRRLRLDFSDIYKKGYSFDSIRGDFAFAQGKAHTSNLEVLGPTGRIDLAGETDLLARRLDQQVTVTPNLDATLPIAGTLAGGPVAGLAVLVAQKLMSDEVDKINRFEYRLNGPWADPEITQLDTGGTLSKILKPLRGATPEAAAEVVPDTGLQTPALPGVGTERTAQSEVEAASAEQAGDTNEASDGVASRALRGLLDVLGKSRTHGADLPGVE